MTSRAAGRQFRMWMPQMPLTLVSARSATPTHPAYATFRVLPRMTKHEIYEYLTQIYRLPVRKVNTMNYEGKRKRLMSNAGMAFFKYKDFKKAVVTFDESLQDVGLGLRVLELEEQEEEGSSSEEETPMTAASSTGRPASKRSATWRKSVKPSRQR